MERVDILIIGGGAAGIAAAKSACARGCKVAVVDRKPRLGGVLLQCSHPGFGARRTGMEYADSLLGSFPKEAAFIPNTTVLSVEKTKIARLSGGRELAFSCLILATGCREIPAGALPIAGTRPQWIYTAGQMQEMMNLHGIIPPGPVVILGSGDIGLIMADQIAALDIPVTLVEQRQTCGGMARNRRCLTDYPIGLICGQTVTEVMGQRYLEQCRLSGGGCLPCKSLLIAAGLRPERTLIAGLGEPEWLFLCGNCNHIHPMVEGVTAEGSRAGMAAAEKIRGGL